MDSNDFLNYVKKLFSEEKDEILLKKEVSLIIRNEFTSFNSRGKVKYKDVCYKIIKIFLWNNKVYLKGRKENNKKYEYTIDLNGIDENVFDEIIKNI